MLGNAYLQMQRTNDAVALFDRALTNPAISYGEVAAVAQLYSKMGYGYLYKLETALQKLVTLAPEPASRRRITTSPRSRPSWAKIPRRSTILRIAMDLSAKRLKPNPNAARSRRHQPHGPALRRACATCRNSKKSSRPK